MSTMYGKRRVVLSNNHNRIVICGSDHPSSTRPGTHCGTYWPVGYWYKLEGLFYADLKLEFGAPLSKGLAGVPTRKALREFVMALFKDGPHKAKD